MILKGFLKIIRLIITFSISIISVFILGVSISYLIDFIDPLYSFIYSIPGFIRYPIWLCFLIYIFYRLIRFYKTISFSFKKFAITILIWITLIASKTIYISLYPIHSQYVGYGFHRDGFFPGKVIFKKDKVTINDFRDIYVQNYIRSSLDITYSDKKLFDEEVIRLKKISKVPPLNSCQYKVLDLYEKDPLEINKYSKLDILEVDKNDFFFLMIPLGATKYGGCSWVNQYQIVAINPKNKNILYIRESYS